MLHTRIFIRRKLFSIATVAFGWNSVLADSSAEQTSACVYNKNIVRWECHASGHPPPTDTESTTSALIPQHELDWIHQDFLTKDQKKVLRPGCSGVYIDPLKHYSSPLSTAKSTSNDQLAELPLVIEANSASVIEAHMATLSGNILVSQGPRSISADRMSYDQLTDYAELEGKVSIRQPGILILGEGATVSMTEERAEFKGAQFIMHDMHMRGSGESVIQQGSDKIVLRGGRLTSCEPNSNGWLLEGEELGIDRESGQGYGKNVKLKIGGVPVFYLPYINFPVGDERRSGFLSPTFSRPESGGISIAAPYYFNLAPNYDATLTPRLVIGRGAMLETEFRHMNKYFYTELGAAFLHDDDGGGDADVDRLIQTNQATEAELRPFRGNNRWHFGLHQTGGQRQGWYSNINIDRVSDVDYFRDLGTSSFSVANTTYLTQSISTGTTLQNWQLNARLQDYQTLLLDLDSPYQKVPEITADGSYNFASGNLSLNNQVTQFDHKDERRRDGSSIITGRRIVADYRAKWHYQTSGIFIRPEIGYKHLQYNLEVGSSDRIDQRSVGIGAPQASLDMGLIFENMTRAVHQTLEPRAYFLYRQYTSHDDLYAATASGQNVNFDTSSRTFSYGQLYRDSRFSGSDRLDDASQMTLGLTNRWFSQYDNHEFFNFSFGKINHFRDRRVGLIQEIPETEKSSEYALEFGANWRNGSSFFGNMIFNDRAQEVDRFSAGYNFASRSQLTLFSISYNYLRANPEVDVSEKLDQLDTALIAPINKQWYVMARANYDFENKQELESFIGFEYDDCCYRVRFLVRRWLDSNISNFVSDEDSLFDQGVFFEFSLKGLGGSSSKVNPILRSAIPGFERRERALSH